MAFTPCHLVHFWFIPVKKKKLGDSPLSLEDSLVLNPHHER